MTANLLSARIGLLPVKRFFEILLFWPDRVIWKSAIHVGHAMRKRVFHYEKKPI